MKSNSPQKPRPNLWDLQPTTVRFNPKTRNFLRELRKVMGGPIPDPLLVLGVFDLGMRWICDNADDEETTGLTADYVSASIKSRLTKLRGAQRKPNKGSLMKSPSGSNRGIHLAMDKSKTGGDHQHQAKPPLQFEPATPLPAFCRRWPPAKKAGVAGIFRCWVERLTKESGMRPPEEAN